MASTANKKNRRSIRKTLLDGDVAFQVTEAYKNLRTNLTFALSTKPSKVFVVSSALTSEGKSTVAANIGITMAEADMKTLIIDCDLRKPVQHKIFKVTNEKGLSTLLGGIHSFKEVVHKNIVDNLDLITCGTIPPNPSELLASDKMKTLLEELSKYYDYVILDTPPINIVTDALTLIDSTAGFLLAARYDQSTYDSLGDAIEAIKMAEGSILGVVITNVSVSKGKYGGKYNYRYRYKYKYKYDYSYGAYAYDPNHKDEDDDEQD